MDNVWLPASATANPSASVNRVGTRTGSPAGKPGGETRGVRGFDADDLQIRFERVQHRRHARQQSAAAHRHEHSFSIGNLLQNFKRQRPLPRDHFWIVKRGNISQLTFPCQTIGFLARFVESIAVKNHRRAELTATPDFHQRRKSRHNHCHRNAQQAAMPR